MKRICIRITAVLLIFLCCSGCMATMEPLVEYKDPELKNLEIAINLDLCTAPKTAGDYTIAYRLEPEDHQPYIDAFLNGTVREKEETETGTAYLNENKVLVITKNMAIEDKEYVYAGQKAQSGFRFRLEGEIEPLGDLTFFHTLDSCAYYRNFLNTLNGNEFDFKPIGEVIEETDQILAEIGLADTTLYFYGAYSAETIKRMEFLLGNRSKEERPGEQPKEDQYLLIYEKEVGGQLRSRIYFTYGRDGLLGAQMDYLIEEATLENTYTPCTAYEAITAVAAQFPNFSAKVVSAEFWPRYNVWEILMRTETAIPGDPVVSYDFYNQYVDARTGEIVYREINELGNRFNSVQKELFEKYKPDHTGYEAQ